MTFTTSLGELVRVSERVNLPVWKLTLPDRELCLLQRDGEWILSYRAYGGEREFLLGGATPEEVLAEFEEQLELYNQQSAAPDQIETSLGVFHLTGEDVWTLKRNGVEATLLLRCLPWVLECSWRFALDNIFIWGTTPEEAVEAAAQRMSEYSGVIDAWNALKNPVKGQVEGPSWHERLCDDRQREKQASREADEQALADGSKSREQLREENAKIRISRIHWDQVRAPR